MSIDAFEIAINGKRVQVATIWAHLKQPVSTDYATYFIGVSCKMAHVVFGTEKPDSLSWADYVLANVHEFGTFVVDGYVKSLTNLAKTSRGPFEWVLITVDDIREETGLICLTGKAERFNNEKFGVPELKCLR
jgi:hypothetical protein